MVPALDFVDSSPGEVAINGHEGARVNLSGSEGIRVLNNDIFGAEEVRVPMEVEGEKVGDFDSAIRVDEDMGPRAGDAKNEANRIEPRVERIRVTSSAHGKRQGEMGKSSVSEYDSILSKFDEFAAAGPSRPLGYGFEIGDMVWGKVKSHPWWPGHIYSEAFATPSVRRSKREGHVLVAFFGDSSYGWFDPAELIAFDPNYAEKSRQTNSRTFVKAVEEAVDEASRRRALGLACWCRNPYNFRPMDVQGYFAVDVGDYEPGTVYSANQINKARDSFQSKETLAFVKQLAMTPTSVEHEGIHFIKNRATVLAYRKAVFEEFDETYAQAFGHQPVRPARPTQDTIQQPSRAPLSGPLVIAEALGKGKSSAKSTKVKDQPKKEKYLFKRRENTNSPKEASSAQPVFVEDSSAIADGNFVLQKRTPAVPLESQIPAMQEQTKILGLGRDLTGQEALTTEEKLAVSNFSMAISQTNTSKVESAARSRADQAPPGYSSHLFEAKPSLDKGKAAVGEMKERLGSISRDNPGIVSDIPYSIMVDSKDGRPSSAAVKPAEGFEQVQDGSMTEDKIHGGGSRMPTDSGAKKTKARKRPREGLNSEKSVLLQKKRKKELMSSSTEKSVLLEKKKKKKALMSSDTMQMRAIGGKSGASASKEAGKSVLLALAPREDLQVDHQKKGDPASTSLLPGFVQTDQMAGRGQVELELPQLLSDLRALALYPFHDVERRSAFIRKVFLRFRSLVYQKSIASFPLFENESNETRASKSPTVNAGYESPPGVTIRDLPSSKAQKPPFRDDDPTKGGRKRGPSDRQEEIALKKKKKLSDLKLLTTEKKVVAQKAPELPRVDNKEPVAPKLKLGKPGSVKKPVPLARSPEPTMLVMKFPPGATLPSLPELKARFARFGPLDPSALRVFWQSLTCRVVFRYKQDAQAALRFVEGSNNLFGSTNVRCSIRESGVAALESDSSKVQREDASVGTQSRDSAVEQRPAAPFSSQLLQQPGVQLKSCLKKSNGEEIGSVPGGNGGGSKGTPRVKFMLGGEDSRNNFNNNNNANFADGGASSSSSSHAMEIDSKNFQKVVTPPPSLPVLPLRTVQLSRPPNNLHYADTLPRNAYNFNTPNAPPRMPSVDIGQQMLSLLTRCNDVVTNVTGMLGYVPYHPL
ncbi:hypothetical protein RJ639_044858 [Escallonia herrerae]|uniref:PWWP domain-containing protein n=1 Tax=Escallonia herrerae TaxID=1293975 RepID=A0AA88WBG3_9ASTE|nr:hypothetical protein RJ639_044858 [Escallonia herrerae]